MVNRCPVKSTSSPINPATRPHGHTGPKWRTGISRKTFGFGLFYELAKLMNSMLRTLLMLCLTAFLYLPASAQDGPHLRDSVAAAANDTARALYLIRLGEHYLTRPGNLPKDMDSALLVLEDARKIAIKNNYLRLYTRSIFYQCLVHIEAGNISHSVALLPALDSSEQTIVSVFLASAFLTKNGEYKYDLDSSVMYGRQALVLAKATGQDFYIPHINETLATALTDNRDLPAALAMLPDVAPATQVRILYNIGNYYRAKELEKKEDLDTAYMFAYRAMELAKQLNDPKAISDCAYLLSRTDMEAGRCKPGIYYFPLLRGEQLGHVAYWTALESLRYGDPADSTQRYMQLSRNAYGSVKNTEGLRKCGEMDKAIRLLQTSEAFIRQLPVDRRFQAWWDTAAKYAIPGPLLDDPLMFAAIGCLHRALQLGDSLNNNNYRYKAWMQLGNYHCKTGLTGLAWNYFRLAADQQLQLNHTASVAAIWQYAGDVHYVSRYNFAKKATAYRLARHYFLLAKNDSSALKAGLDEARNYVDDSRIAEANALLDTLLQQFPPHRNKDAFRIYQFLSGIAQQNGDNTTALRHSMTALREAELQNNRHQVKAVKVRLAEIYNDLGDYEKSIGLYRSSLDLHRQPGFFFDYASAFMLAELLIEHRSPQEALDFLEEASRVHAPNDHYSRILLAGARGRCYHAMGLRTQAEEAFQQSIKNMKLERITARVGSLLQYNIGKFYFENAQYRRAAEHLNNAATNKSSHTGISLARNIQYLLFQCDSAENRHEQSIAHYQLYKYYNDSLFSIAQSRQISELNIQYETEQKDQSLLVQAQEIQLRKQHIALLERQGLLQLNMLQHAQLEQEHSIKEALQKDQEIKLKSKSVELLKQQYQYHESELAQEMLLRNVTFGGGALLIIIIGLLVNGYRLKQRNNRSLRQKQTEIGQKNLSLEKLLGEKEWLLKEIHHRVKNNLQIVMSLLNSQSAYVQNDAALTAIRDSQHRVQAISLIHKKLYQSDNVGLIFMPHYIHELVDSLIQGFDADRHLRFRLEVAPIQLDVSQAVPLGLILNEAITNAIKYAFPGNREGLIDITFEQTAEGYYALTIKDNGTGLPEGFDPAQCRSLGMSLMEGLSSELGGHFAIRNNGGTEIHIWFQTENYLRHELVLQDESALPAMQTSPLKAAAAE